MTSPIVLPQGQGSQQQQQEFKEPAPPAAAAAGGNGDEEAGGAAGGHASIGGRRKSRGTLVLEQRQQSKWGFVPGDEDTLMLELDRHGEQQPLQQILNRHQIV